MSPASFKARAQPCHPVSANQTHPDISTIDGSRARDTKKLGQWKTHLVESSSGNIHAPGVDVLSSMKWQQQYNLQLPISESSSGSAPANLVLWYCFSFGSDSPVILCFNSFCNFGSLVSPVILQIIQNNLKKCFSTSSRETLLQTFGFYLH